MNTTKTNYFRVFFSSLKKNKKASTIIPESIVGIVFALILIGSTVLLLSQCTRLSDQAEKNFYQFADKIEEMKDLVDGESKVFRTIQDPGTFIIAFTGNEESVYIGFSGHFSYPEEKCKGKSCLVLCQKFEGLGDVQCSDLKVKVLDDLTISSPWASRRTEDNERRALVQIEVSNRKITITGGNEPEVVEDVLGGASTL
ncbi:MAG: hypothetical protein CMH61_01715 [Nanoarchaeota archaeon]|nr:hypothetical protein [Nanoarchaeota archaeon]|tara:strand:+ start:4916 stop:5512 length:597 start_codon:yes stop_codon:yes gene_type:complete